MPRPIRSTGLALALTALVAPASQGQAPVAGTGGGRAPLYLRGVTGAGPMPRIDTARVAACAGDGRADDTGCLQRALDAAAGAKQPLLLPATPAWYRITAPLRVATSVIGVGGMPTIRQTSSCGTRQCAGLRLEQGMRGWIHNLHLVGAFQGQPGEFAHNISVGGVDGVTIQGNVLESPVGDNIADNAQELDRAAARNVLIFGNTLLTPARCAISLVNVSSGWAIVNNRLVDPVPWVSPIDIEPWRPSSRISDVEVAYNEITAGPPRRGASPGDYTGVVAASGWFDPTPGENIYVHHNYGSWPFARFVAVVAGKGTFRNVVDEKNVPGEEPVP
ncbi:MAG TPA: hypothetical protein VFG59_04050 [Anaeromyxobacter sp.]|nr:hypothetical protein [Anaeromyxobacter sp.]